MSGDVRKGGKHFRGDLQQMQSLPLAAKIDMTQRRIREWVEHWDGMCYVAFSGGVDSTVLKHLVDSLYPDIPAVFSNTGLEYPQLQRFVADIRKGEYSCFNPDVTILRPEFKFDEIIRRYGYPVVSKEVSNTIEGARRSISKGVYSFRLAKLGVDRSEYGGLADSGEHDYANVLKGSKFTQFQWRHLLDSDFRCSDMCCEKMKKKTNAGL
jgi:3'-phosphoadenosine 5'-phosphosulfate sulfotransferase (PAPS reductase)/FAD synthetase